MDSWQDETAEKYCFACAENGHWAEECPKRVPILNMGESSAVLEISPEILARAASPSGFERDERSQRHPMPPSHMPLQTNPRARPGARRFSLIGKALENASAASETSSNQSEPSIAEESSEDEGKDESQRRKSSHWEVAKAKLRAIRAFKAIGITKDAATFIKEAQTQVAKNRNALLEHAGQGTEERRTSVGKAEKKNKMSDDMIQAYVKDILSKNPEERTEDDKNFLKDCTKRLKFFVNMSPNVHADLCKVMQYVRVPADEVVFYQGSIGKTFYVILSGSVTIHVKSSDEEHQNEVKKSLNTKDILMKRSSIAKAPSEKQVPTSPQMTPLSEERTDEPYDFGRLVGTLASGDAFGELALLTNPTAPRAASIIAVEDTEFLTIHKTDYDRTLKRIQVQLLESKINFLRGMSIFRSWDSKRLTRFSHFMKNQTFNSAETIIVKQGEVSDNIYLIYKGACRIIFQAELENDRNSTLPWLLMEDSSVFFKNLSNNYTPTPYTLMAPQKRKARLELAVLGPGEMFGEGGVIAGFPQLGMVMAENDTELLIINKSDFNKRMDEPSKQIVRKVWEMKNTWLENRLQEIIKLKVQSRPTDIFTNAHQGIITPREPPHANLSARDNVGNSSPPLRRPQPPDPERMKSLATPRNPRPPARNRRRLLELLQQKLNSGGETGTEAGGDGSGGVALPTKENPPEATSLFGVVPQSPQGKSQLPLVSPRTPLTGRRGYASKVGESPRMPRIEKSPRISDPMQLAMRGVS